MLDEDDDTTHEIPVPKLLPPVKRVEDLPIHNVEEGALCLVEDSTAGSDRLYRFIEGQWTPS